jgi:hypothetical protein
MDWTQVLTIVGAILAIIVATGSMFLWSRSESRADCRRIEDLIASIYREIQAEIKDFHGRLCAIEERKKMGKE